MTSTALGQFASVRGRAVAWDVLGEGPPLVFVHGSPWSSAMWRPLAERLSSRFEVRLFDLSGHGLSSKDPAQQTGIGTQAEVFVDLLAMWGLDRPHIIAHGTGAAIALRARLMHRRSFASLCLVGGIVFRPWVDEFAAQVRRNVEVFADLPEVIHRGVVESYVRSAAYRRVEPEVLSPLVIPWLGEAGQAAFYRVLSHADERFTEEFEADLDRLREPVHLVWGSDDAWSPPDQAYRLRDVIDQASLHVVTGAGHLLTVDSPHRMQAEIVRWAESVR